MMVEKIDNEPSPPISTFFGQLTVGETFRLGTGTHLYVKVSVGHAFDLHSDRMTTVEDAASVKRMGSRIHYWEK